MDQDATLIRLAVLGSPVKHSHSPWIHAEFAGQAGLPLDYQAIEVAPDHLSRVVQQLADSGARGCNITLPHKQQAFSLASLAGERARIAASANTLVFETKSRWRAENTDGPGLLRDLLENQRQAVAGRSVCVIGAGGAAAGILYDLLLRKPASLSVLNRNAEHAHALAQRLSPHGKITVGGLDEASAQGYELLIHASAAGHHGSAPLLVESWFAQDGFCYDLNYGVAHLALAQWCADRGVARADGLGMLVEQAAESFEIWTGFQPETGPVIQALRARLGSQRKASG